MIPQKLLTISRADVGAAGRGSFGPSPEGAMRSWRERAIQTAACKLGGLLIIPPIWTFATGATVADTVALLACLSVAVMSWTALYNTAFDLIEARVTARSAGERRHPWHLIRAVGLEVSAVLLAWPLIAVIAGFGCLEALVADLGLTVVYGIYGYFFHRTIDRLRPVLAPPPRPKWRCPCCDRDAAAWQQRAE